MSVMHPKAEVAKRRWHFRFVPTRDIRAFRHHHDRAALKADDARRADIALKGIRGNRLTYRRTDEARSVSSMANKIIVLWLRENGFLEEGSAAIYLPFVACASSPMFA
jgi:hypothetical protein